MAKPKVKIKIRRNPSPLLKKGGVHRRSKSGERQKAKNKLRQEVRALDDKRDAYKIFNLSISFPADNFSVNTHLNYSCL